MKKLFAIIGVLLSLVIIAVVVIWMSKTRIAQRTLQKQLGVPVRIEKLSIDTEETEIKKIHIGNPKGSKTKTAFASDKILIEYSLRQLFSDPLTIDTIELDNAFVGIEFYGSGEADTNWTRILNHQPKRKKQKQSDYMIRNVYINNLTVSVTSPNGKTKVYPTISQLEFHDISNESGLPIDEIEKAIFKLVLKSAIEKYGLKSILKSVNPQNLPFNLIPFLNKKEQKKSEPRSAPPSSDEDETKSSKVSSEL